MFDPQRILYEDNHLLVVNKRAGELVQPDPTGDPALEDEIKAFLGAREAKPGNVFLGVCLLYTSCGEGSKRISYKDSYYYLCRK